jgi:hypothetical protein
VSKFLSILFPLVYSHMGSVLNCSSEYKTHHMIVTSVHCTVSANLDLVLHVLLIKNCLALVRSVIILWLLHAIVKELAGGFGLIAT